MRSGQTWWAKVRESLTRRKTAKATGSSEALSALVRRYDRGERDFAGMHLKGNPHLVGVDLRQADLTGADLSGACLAKARLDGACLRFADLRNAQLYEASLRSADLRQANLSGANLLLADLQAADLTGARVGDATLASAFSLEGACMPNGVQYDAATQDRLQEKSLEQARSSFDNPQRNSGA